MMGIPALQVVDVQGHAGMIDQALEKFGEQLGIEAAQAGASEFHCHEEAGTAGQVDHHPGQGLVQGHIGVAVTAQPLLVAPGLGQGLAQGDADIFDRVVGIDMQIALGFDIQVDQAVPGDLVEHVIKKVHAGGEPALTAAIQIEPDRDPGFQGVTGNFDLPHEAWPKGFEQAAMIPFHPFCKAPERHAMCQYWSAVVRGLTPYTPGEQPKLANLIKLNTNENPYPPSPRVVAAIQAELGDDGARLRLYPDPDGERLKAAVARQFASLDIGPEQVFVGNGSDEVLAHVFQALLKHEAPILFPDITYSFYPVYCGLYGIPYETIALDEHFAIRPGDYTQPNGGIVFPNPNAPTGRPLALSGIETMVLANPDSVVVIDEAYVDFGADTAIALVSQHPNLLVTQTLSKSRSLAGLRVGFAVGHPDLIEALERIKNSFNSYPLDRLALAGAVAALDDAAWFEQTRQAVIQSREHLSQRLGKLGFTVIPSAANFVFARHPDRDAAELARQLRERSIIVRHFKLPRIDQFLRISIGTDGECAALLAALTEILA